MKKVLIVGAGFAGCVVARQLAESGITVLLIDKRQHIGGNAFDVSDTNGIFIHPYGPHIFHTNSKEIFDYLSDFTDWTPYEHRVLSVVNNEYYEFPVNLNTLNKVFGLNLSKSEVPNFLETLRDTSIGRPSNTEELVLAALGSKLYEMFYKNYTRKQWGLDPKDLKTSVAARIPVRHNADSRYFTDMYQYMPAKGYTQMFLRMLDHDNIRTQLNTNFSDLNVDSFDHVFYTGPIDEYYGFKFGRLPYRSLRFEHISYSEVDSYQPAATVNYPNDHRYTRITEFKKLTGQQAKGTSIVKEYPTDQGDPYYPIPTEENEILYKKYQDLASKESAVTFVGRLAQYKYYNMDQVVGAALVAAKSFLNQ